MGRGADGGNRLTISVAPYDPVSEVRALLPIAFRHAFGASGWVEDAAASALSALAPYLSPRERSEYIDTITAAERERRLISTDWFGARDRLVRAPMLRADPASDWEWLTAETLVPCAYRSALETGVDEDVVLGAIERHAASLKAGVRDTMARDIAQALSVERDARYVERPQGSDSRARWEQVLALLRSL